MPELDVRQPFTRAEALAAGFDPAARRDYVRIFHGVYVAASVRITPELRVRAALKFFGPDAFAKRRLEAALPLVMVRDVRSA